MKGDNSISDIFKSYFNNIFNILQKIEHNPIMAFDVAAMVYTIADYAALSANGDRRAVFDEIWDSFLDITRTTNCNVEFAEKAFDERSDFYAEIVRCGPQVNLCMPGYTPEGNADTAMTRCAIAFANCICTPDYIYNYGNAPIFVRDISEMLFISREILLPTIEFLSDLFIDVHKNLQQSTNSHVFDPLVWKDPEIAQNARQYEELFSSSKTMNTPHMQSHPKTTDKSYFGGMLRLGAYIGGIIAIIWIVIELLIT